MNFREHNSGSNTALRRLIWLCLSSPDQNYKDEVYGTKAFTDTIV